MKKVELSEHIRIKRDENYEVLRTLKETISQKIRAEFESETKGVSDENESFHKQDKEFREKASELLKTLNTQTKLKVKTQVGRGSTLIHEYEGYLRRKYTDGVFDFIDESKYDGKPFSIGLSCLLSIEVVE